MNSETSRSTFVDAIKNKPVVSSLCTAFAPTAVITGKLLPIDSTLGVEVMGGLLYSSPALCAVGVGLGVVNMVRHKSLLSKAFSTAAIGAGGLGLWAWQDGLANPGIMEAFGYISAMTAVSASGAGNLASYATRNLGPKIGVVKPNDPSAK